MISKIRLGYLSNNYKSIVEGSREVKVSQDRIREYFDAKIKVFNRDFKFFTSTWKLHPVLFSKREKMKTEWSNLLLTEWLLNASYRHLSFCDKIHPLLQDYDYNHWLKEYEIFLLLCKENPRQIIVPSLIQDFMWHSHLQNNKLYHADTASIFGTVLDHNDTIPDNLLEKYREETKEIRDRYNQSRRDTTSVHSVGNGSACSNNLLIMPVDSSLDIRDGARLFNRSICGGGYNSSIDGGYSSDSSSSDSGSSSCGGGSSCGGCGGGGD